MFTNQFIQQAAHNILNNKQGGSPRNNKSWGVWTFVFIDCFIIGFGAAMIGFWFLWGIMCACSLYTATMVVIEE